MKSLKTILRLALLAVGLSSGELFAATVTATFRVVDAYAAHIGYNWSGTGTSSGGEYITAGSERTWTFEQGSYTFRVTGGSGYTHQGDFYFDHIDDGGVYSWNGVQITHYTPPPPKTLDDVYAALLFLALGVGFFMGWILLSPLES